MTLRILIVDDDGSRDALAALLRDDGYDVITACDGAEALELIAAHAPNLVITDLRMPVLDGIGLLNLMPKCLPAIVVSAFAPKEPAARRAGAEAFFAKPIDYGRLVATVQEFDRAA
jgi:two-component system chemotaxis response regulator CheY